MATPLDIEDLKIYFYDTFLSTDQFDEEVSGTGYIHKNPCEIKLHGGVTSGSTARINYKTVFGNPRYGELIMKMILSSKENIIAFWGFKETLDPPALDMVESHAGFLIINNKIYFSTGDGYNQQRVEVVTIDTTLMYEYKIKFNEFYYKPLPQVIDYLGIPTVTRVEREWKLLQTNSTYVPENETHYIMIYLENLTTTTKYINVDRIIYKEEYAD